MSAMVAELHARAPLFEAGAVRSIYFGGGTPSLAPHSFFEYLLADVRSRFIVRDDVEITCEINPGTVERQTLEGYLNLGINRLSLGWQSTHQSLLQVLGRDHSVGESERAFHDGRAVGFENISLDLIYAVPGQTTDDLARDLETIVSLGPDHVSIYELTFHDGTPFERYRQTGRLAPQPDETIVEMTNQIEDAMEQAGLSRYEVSNFARLGKRSRHNAAYWTGAPFLGVGPGAHSFMRHGWERGFRWEGIRRPERYIQSMGKLQGRPLPFDQPDAVSFIDMLTHKQLLTERIMTAMRMPEGIALNELELGEQAQAIEEAMRVGVKRGWLEDRSDRLLPTMEGLRYADGLAELFF